jgi:hypothetical protein
MAGNEHTIQRGEVLSVGQQPSPAIEINPRDVVHFEAQEVTDWQIKPGSLASALTTSTSTASTRL